MSRYRGLLVDFGGVLTSSIQEAFRAFCEREGIERERLGRILRASYREGGPDSLVARAEIGAITQEEFQRRMAVVLSEGLDRPISPDGLVDRMLDGVETVPEMVEAVRRARAAGIRTALVSNSWSTRQYRIGEADPAELFDAVLISGELGLRKPDVEVFRLAAERIGVPGEACVFVDDLRENVEAAERVGMRGILHEDPARTIPELEKLLGW